MRKQRTVFEIGQKYNRLEIIDICGYDKHKNKMYKCRCDCGNIITVRGNALTSGNTKSCGCYGFESRKAKRLPNNKGVINQIILGYKRHARDRGLDWELTYEQVEDIIQSPCFYCGEEKSNLKITKNCQEGFRYNGIDRIDSSKGYVIGNVVASCKKCNLAKMDMDQKDFIIWVQKVADYTKKTIL